MKGLGEPVLERCIYVNGIPIDLAFARQGVRPNRDGELYV